MSTPSRARNDNAGDAAPAVWNTVNGTLKSYPLSRSRLYRLMAEGRITAKKMGSRTVIHQPSVDEYLNALPDAFAA